jgi:S1-C subfamily serine protease
VRHAGILAAAFLTFALIAAGCDRASELIPGDAPSATPIPPSTTASPVVAPPILPPATLDVGTAGATSALTQALTDEELAASVVLVEARQSGAPVRNGSGVVVDSDLGLIVTSYDLVVPHAADGTTAYDELLVGTAPPADEPTVSLYQAEAVAADPALDLAVLRVTGGADGEEVLEPGAFDLPAVTVGDASLLVRGDELRLLGQPGIGLDGLRRALTVTEALVLGFRGNEDVSGRAWIKTDARLPYGHGGGPAFDAQGALVGIAAQVLYAPGVEVGQIRPITLAEPLIQAARDAGPEAVYAAPLWRSNAGPQPSNGVAVSSIDFAANALSSEEGGDLFDYAASFPDGQQRLHYEFALQGVVSGAIVEERWYLNGVLQDGISSSLAWTNGDFAILSDRVLAPPERGLQPGIWRLEIWVDEVMRSAGGVTIGLEGLPIAPGARNFQFGASVTPEQTPRGAPTSQDDRLLAFFEYSSAGSVRHIRWIVFRDGSPVYESPSLPWRGGDDGTWWIGYQADGPLGEGFWEIEVYFDDVRAGVDGIQLS